MTVRLPLGPWLERQRSKLYLTQDQVAQRVSCATVTLRKIEAGERRPSATVAGKLAQALGVPVAAQEAFVAAATQGLAPLPSTNLPRPSTSFIGRTEDVGRLEVLLMPDATTRLVTLTGPGGAGKTRLALHIAAALLPLYDDGVYFIDLTGVTRPGFVVPTIIAALNFANERSADLEELQEYLERKRMLLVLDNFEQVVSAAPIVSAMTAKAQRCKFLVTSRVRLDTYGEHIHLVAPFVIPEDTEASRHGQLLHNDALQLLSDRARAVCPDFDPANADPGTLLKICAMLDGLPLAIELAASHLRSQSPSEVLASWSSRLDVQGHTADIPVRQRSLRATLDGSYHLLSADLQQLAQRLAVFVGSCALADIEAVCAAPAHSIPIETQIDALVRHNLVQHRTGPDGVSRYGMLETIREYMGEHLQAGRECEQMRRRHAQHFLSWAEGPDPKSGNDIQSCSFSRLEDRQRELRAALDWMIEQHEVDFARRLCRMLWPFWNERNYVHEGRRLIEQVLAMSGNPEDVLQADVLLGASALAHSEADYAVALQHARAAHVLYVQHSNANGIAAALVRQGITHRARGEQHEAALLFEDSLALQESVGDTASMALTLRLLGNACYSSMKFAEAEQHFSASKQLFLALQDRRGLGILLADMGLCAIFQGRFVEAQLVLEESLRLLRTLGQEWEATAALSYLGFATLFAGDTGRARQLTTQCLALRQQQGDKVGISYNLDAFAGIAILEGLVAPPEMAGRVFAKGARLAGAAHALRSAVQSPLIYSSKPLYEQYRGKLRVALGDTLYDICFAAGATMPLDAIIAEALTSETPG